MNDGSALYMITPVTARKTTPPMPVRTRYHSDARVAIVCARPKSSARATATPTREARRAMTDALMIFLLPRWPSLRRRSTVPITAPATNPKPLAAPRRTTTLRVEVATSGASIDSRTLVSVMPAMIHVGVHASSRA